jgi:hypothetical protein
VNKKLKTIGRVLWATCFTVTFSNCGNTAGTFVNFNQAQRVGRPLAGGDLLLTTQSMHIYNAMRPSDEVTTNADSNVTNLFSEMQTVIQTITTFGTSLYGTNQPGFQNYVVGFAPNVLRINTENNFAPSGASNEDSGFTSMAYNADFGLVGGTSLIFTGGRKIEDEAFNITYAYLFSGVTAATTGFTAKAVNGTGGSPGTVMGWSDELTYDMGSTCAEAEMSGGPAVPNAASKNSYQAPGHYCLYGQSSRYTTATFPYLAIPSGTY